MANDVERLNKTANLFGFDLSIFPGIPIGAIPIFFIVKNFKSQIMSAIGLNFNDAYQEYFLILAISLICAIVLYKISGWCLDWIYDGFYPEKKNKKSELNIFISSAREKWISLNYIYNEVSIYQPTLEKVEIDDVNEFNKIKQKLSISKVFRIIVIPILIIGIIRIFQANYFIGLILILMSIISLIISFNLRAEHSKRLYRWFLNTKQ